MDVRERQLCPPRGDCKAPGESLKKGQTQSLPLDPGLRCFLLCSGRVKGFLLTHFPPLLAQPPHLSLAQACWSLDNKSVGPSIGHQAVGGGLFLGSMVALLGLTTMEGRMLDEREVPSKTRLCSEAIRGWRVVAVKVLCRSTFQLDGNIMDKTESVTTVLNPYSDFSRIRPEVLRHAAERGTRIHGAIAAHLQGLWVPPLDDESQPRFDSFRRWADIMVDQVVIVEQELRCASFGYHGHPDAALVMKGREGVTVVDWKSPVSASKTWKGQLSAYWHLVDKHGNLPPGMKVLSCGAVMLHPGGKTAKFMEYSDIYNQYFSAFLGALQAYKFFK